MAEYQFSRRDITFHTRDKVKLGGWLYLPEGADDSLPCVILSHGFSASIEHGLAEFAEAFAGAGFAALVYDHRGYGLSGGGPSLETNPLRQMHDMRDAVTFATLLPEVDERRIGLWGTSYSGGHVLVVAAVDRRVKCVVATVPVVSGSEMTRRLIGEMNMASHLAACYEARKQEMQSGEVEYRRHTTYEQTLQWFEECDPGRTWQNRISVLSHDMAMEYEPGDYVHRISPTPLLMILTDADTRVCTDLQLDAYARAREPKRLLLLKGGHYDPYIRQFQATSVASVEWFLAHLGAGG